MQEVCDVLEQLVQIGAIKNYALGGATAAGFYGEPLATRDIDVFVFLNPPPGSLHVEPGSFLDEHLKNSESDLLYRIQWEDKSAFVYLLFEHQRREDPWLSGGD